MEKIQIKDGVEKAVEKMVEVFNEGGLVVFPSDTVYGLAVDAENQKAVDKLLAFKNRWTGKAVSVAVADIEMAKKYVRLNKQAERIYENLLPGPFTVISRGKQMVARGIEAEDGTLGIRIADNRLMEEITKKLGGAMTATSANLSGRSPHYSIESFINTLSKKKREMIDLLIDGGKLPLAKPSTVINTVGKRGILRRGDLLIGGGGKSLLSKSEAETKRIAKFLLKKQIVSNKPIVFGLTGDLGCGKTVFARGMAESLGIKERIQSPTFVIMNEYKIPINQKSTPNPSPSSCGAGFEERRGKFLHFDLYRIERGFELDEIDFVNLFESGSVACIEWPERMGKKNFFDLKKRVNYVGVRFSYVDEKTREIEI